ncbi:hypothetical protein FOL47_004273 [Perkinsus chesapeaki]|uniref:Uncharacterized protein n=1 Tax=Perkinsus chesapeaki TaxID=330153 RepID=A0A7J6M3N2_PERCH|nr:hypothetical protein FOL47_004273 [Perkinsus chesapeaki]
MNGIFMLRNSKPLQFDQYGDKLRHEGIYVVPQKFCSDSGSDSSGRRSPGRRDLLADESDDGDELSLDEDRRRKRPRVGGGSGNTPDPKQRRIEKREQREAMTEVYRIAAEQQQGGQSSLWAACVALAGHLDAGLMSVPLYRDMSRQIYQQFAHEFDNTVEDLQPQRTENPNGDGEAQTSVHPLAKGGDGCISLEYREDLKLLLYRHCSLLEAFVHTPYTYAAAGLYHESGTRDVHQYFAECGLQPHSFNQVYISMPLHARLNLMEKLKKYGNRRGLFEMTHFDFLRRDNSAASQTGGPSAAGQVDHLNLTEMSASDMSVVVFAALEACGIPNDGSEDDDNSSTTPLQRKAFFDALDIIRGSNASGTRTALLRGLSVLRHVVSQVAKAIRDRQMYKTVRRENDDTFRLTVLYRVVNPIICSPGVLRRLALFVLHIIYYKTSSRRADRGSLPYIVCCQMPNENFICLGVMPTSISAVGDKKSTFATRFLEASDESGASMDFKAFDASVVEVAGKDFQKWKEALQGQAGNRGDHGNGFDEGLLKEFVLPPSEEEFFFVASRKGMRVEWESKAKGHEQVLSFGSDDDGNDDRLHFYYGDERIEIEGPKKSVEEAFGKFNFLRPAVDEVNEYRRKGESEDKDFDAGVECLRMVKKLLTPDANNWSLRSIDDSLAKKKKDIKSRAKKLKKKKKKVQT